jgi:hypothetical protein
MNKAYDKTLAEYEKRRQRAQERQLSRKLEGIEKAKPYHDDLDETLAGTFPSSDPPAIGGETAIPPKARRGP